MEIIEEGISHLVSDVPAPKIGTSPDLTLAFSLCCLFWNSLCRCFYAKF